MVVDKYGGAQPVGTAVKAGEKPESLHVPVVVTTVTPFPANEPSLTWNMNLACPPGKDDKIHGTKQYKKTNLSNMQKHVQQPRQNGHEWKKKKKSV